MRPPRGWTKYIDEVWKLLKPAYGLVELERLWQLCIEEWITRYGLQTVPGLPQLFILRQAPGRPAVSLIATKVVDDVLLANTFQELRRFSAAISKRFKVGRYISGKPFVFNRVLKSPSSDHSVILSIYEFMETIQYLPLTWTRRKQHEEKCTKVKLTALQSLARKLNFLGHGVLPQACLVASKMHQNVGSLRVKHFQQANTALYLLKRIPCALQYRLPLSTLKSDDMEDLSPLSLAGASTGRSSYGQGGFVTGLTMRRNNSRVYHVLDWHSSKQARVSFSSDGAEILAAAEAADRSLLLTCQEERPVRSLQCAQCLSSMITNRKLFRLVLTVDSYCPYSSINTLHEGKDYRLSSYRIKTSRPFRSNGDLSSPLNSRSTKLR